MIEETGWAGRLKRAIYARMEELSFRSGVATAAGVLAITGLGIGLTITSGAGHEAVAAPLRPAAAATPAPAGPSSASAPSPPASPASVAPEAEYQPVTPGPQSGTASQAPAPQASPPSPSLGPPGRLKSRHAQPVSSSWPGWFAPFAPPRHGTAWRHRPGFRRAP